MNHLLYFCQLKCSPLFYFSMKEIAEMAMVWFVHTNRMGADGQLPVGRAAVTGMMTKGEVLYEALCFNIFCNMKECKTAICSNSVVTVVVCWVEKQDFCGDSLFFGQPACLQKLNYFVGMLVLQLMTSHE